MNFFVNPKNKNIVYVVECTKEGLMFGLELGPLKFERSKRGGDFTSGKRPVATV
ncbi:hypothetical protein M1534_01400 [Patescibacteria group bacterium]|nr:hypothetical protein [Patescibacteria group bacterium]